MPQYLNELPLSENALRSDGTMQIRIMQQGWGSSGYYSQDVIERDIPRVVPPGTHMYFNHPSRNEAVDRPERDIHQLAAVTVDKPVWLTEGPEGPGEYVNIRPYPSVADRINEMAADIGVSIYGVGRATNGEAEGREGPIIEEIRGVRSVDFVTKPGAGGAIVTLFEAEIPLEEARNFAEWLESRLHASMTEIADSMYGNAYINREERIAVSSALGQALNTLRANLLSNQPQLFRRDRWQESPPSADLADNNLEERDHNPAPEDNSMELEEAVGRIETLEQQLAERDTATARLQEQLLLRDARDFVASRIPTTLPEPTRARLQRELIAQVPTVESGGLDAEAYETRISEAVTAAEAEIAAIVGSGRIKGNPPTPTGDQLPTLEESQKRQAELLGFGGGS